MDLVSNVSSIIMFGEFSQIQSEHLGDQGSTLPHLDSVGGDPDQGVGMRVELLLQGDHHDVHRAFLTLDIGGDLADVGVVQGGVNLVQDEEGSRLVAVDGEEQGQGRDGFLSARQVGHRLESFTRSHTVVVDALNRMVISSVLRIVTGDLTSRYGSSGFSGPRKA